MVLIWICYPSHANCVFHILGEVGPIILGNSLQGPSNSHDACFGTLHSTNSKIFLSCDGY